MSSTADDVSKTEETPYSLYFKNQKAVIEEHGAIGPMLIKGLPPKRKHRDEDDSDNDEPMDDSEEEESNEDKAKYTKEDMDSLRFVLITQNRNDMLDEMRDFILGDQADGGIIMFNTSFSYEIEASFHQIKQMRNGKKSWKDKFDLLFAYTYTIMEYDTWMHDNEGGMNEMVSGLARLWKSTLKKSNEELGIDGNLRGQG